MGFTLLTIAEFIIYCIYIGSESTRIDDYLLIFVANKYRTNKTMHELSGEWHYKKLCQHLLSYDLIASHVPLIRLALQL